VRFCDIDEKSKRIASGLARLGFKKGDVLQFVTYETARLYLIQVAIWRLGGAVRGSFQDEAPGKYFVTKKWTIINWFLIFRGVRSPDERDQGEVRPC
jgi:hypothetical protein